MTIRKMKIKIINFKQENHCNQICVLHNTLNTFYDNVFAETFICSNILHHVSSRHFMKCNDSKLELFSQDLSPLQFPWLPPTWQNIGNLHTSPKKMHISCTTSVYATEQSPPKNVQATVIHAEMITDMLMSSSRITLIVAPSQQIIDDKKGRQNKTKRGYKKPSLAD